VVNIIESQESKTNEQLEDQQEEDNKKKIEIIVIKINNLFEEFIQYLSSSGKDNPKFKLGKFEGNSFHNNKIEDVEESSNNNLIELNIISMCNKLKGLFDQYIHYKYNLSRKMVQGQPSTENSFIIGQLNINKSYMYYREKDQQLCFSRTFSIDEMEFVENIIERIHELIHCVTNESFKNYINYILFKVIKLISNYPILHPLFYIRLILLIYEQTEDINEGLCDSLSRIISIISSSNYGFPDISILRTDKDNVDEDINSETDNNETGINNKSLLRPFLKDNNEYSLMEKIKPIEVLLNPYLNDSKSYFNYSKLDYKKESIILRIVCSIICFMNSQSSTIHLLSHNNNVNLVDNTKFVNKEGNH